MSKNNGFIIIAGEDLTTSPLMSQYDSLIKERDVAFQNKNYAEYIRIVMCLMDMNM